MFKNECWVCILNCFQAYSSLNYSPVSKHASIQQSKGIYYICQIAGIQVAVTILSLANVIGN